MLDSLSRHITRAKDILDGNWAGSYTRPAPRLYPHQWNWDSGFIAIGYSRYDTQKAITELKRLFSAQWTNGMLPQIVFNKENLGNYFPEPDFWQAGVSGKTPHGTLTSGITMPPVHALAVLRVYENAKRPDEVVPFLRWIYPRLTAQHRYLYRERDPEGMGLVYIRHPWESGMDNSPMWDIVLKRIDLKSVKVPRYMRRDLDRGVPPESRPADLDYDRFVYLVDLARRHKYDEKAIRQKSPFLLYGPLFNSVLSASNEALVKIAEVIGEPYAEPEEWLKVTSHAISEKLFHDEHRMFDFYDGIERRLLEVDTAAGFMPLFAGAASTEQASQLYEYLNSKSFCALHQGNCFSIPNYDTQKEGFDRKNYWRGPIWININWMLMQGLRRYGFVQKADSVAKDILELPVRFGFHEYYDSFDGRGYGSSDFSWTAALFIDTAYQTYTSAEAPTLTAKIKNLLLRDIVLNDEGEPAEVSTDKLAQEILSTIKDIKGKYYSDLGKVDYDSIRKSPEYADYKRLTASLRNFTPDLLTDDAKRLAFWLNLYNAIVVDGIIVLGLKSSVKEVMGFFSSIKYRIGEQTFSPDDIEHGILRGNARPHMHVFRQFGPFDARKAYMIKRVDPRIHFALVCGSRSCAPIKFYAAETIDADLEAASVNFVNSSEVIVIPEERRLVLSMIFKWYERDFGGRDGVMDFIESYLVDERKKKFLRQERNRLRIDYLYYDWSLNK